MHMAGGGCTGGGRGDARASCASPLGTPLLVAASVLISRRPLHCSCVSGDSGGRDQAELCLPFGRSEDLPQDCQGLQALPHSDTPRKTRNCLCSWTSVSDPYSLNLNADPGILLYQDLDPAFY
jgi:hypothetical protein